MTIEFSQFTNGGTAVQGDTVVGLRSGVNTKFTFPSISSITWQSVTTNTTMVADHGYIVDSMGTVTLSMPASISIGDTFMVILANTGTVIVQLGVSQSLLSLQGVGSAGGTITNSQEGMGMTLVAVSSTKVHLFSATATYFTVT